MVLLLPEERAHKTEISAFRESDISQSEGNRERPYTHVRDEEPLGSHDTQWRYKQLDLHYQEVS